jgi:hypothetical protein
MLEVELQPSAEDDQQIQVIRLEVVRSSMEDAQRTEQATIC